MEGYHLGERKMKCEENSKFVLGKKNAVAYWTGLIQTGRWRWATSSYFHLICRSVSQSDLSLAL